MYLASALCRHQAGYCTPTFGAGIHSTIILCIHDSKDEHLRSLLSALLHAYCSTRRAHVKRIHVDGVKRGKLGGKDFAGSGL